MITACGTARDGHCVNRIAPCSFANQLVRSLDMKTRFSGRRRTDARFVRYIVVLVVGVVVEAVSSWPAAFARRSEPRSDDDPCIRISAGDHAMQMCLRTSSVVRNTLFVTLQPMGDYLTSSVCGVV